MSATEAMDRSASDLDGPAGFGLRSAWGVASVLFILVNAIKRLAPIALQPFSRVSALPRSRRRAFMVGMVPIQ